MSGKADRDAAWATVTAYHQDQLARLVDRVGEAVDRHRAGEIGAFDVDQTIFQYSRAAKELWKFCNGPNMVITAQMIEDGAAVDWWERGAPRRR